MLLFYEFERNFTGSRPIFEFQRLQVQFRAFKVYELQPFLPHGNETWIIAQPIERRVHEDPEIKGAHVEGL